MLLVPVIKDAAVATVDATEEDFTTTLAHDGKTLYEMVSNTACWIKQGRSMLITVPTKADAVDGDYYTVTVNEVTVTYELDKTGDGVASGRVQVDISGGGVVTAANVAAVLTTALNANQGSGAGSLITVTDNADGTITILALGRRLSAAEFVSHASGAVADHTTLAATAGAGSKFCAAGERVLVDGRGGQKISILRDAADGKASLTPLRIVR